MDGVIAIDHLKWATTTAWKDRNGNRNRSRKASKATEAVAGAEL
jgi:hypothetical protein